MLANQLHENRTGKNRRVTRAKAWRDHRGLSAGPTNGGQGPDPGASLPPPRAGRSRRWRDHLPAPRGCQGVRAAPYWCASWRSARLPPAILHRGAHAADRARGRSRCQPHSCAARRRGAGVGEGIPDRLSLTRRRACAEFLLCWRSSKAGTGPTASPPVWVQSGRVVSIVGRSRCSVSRTAWTRAREGEVGYFNGVIVPLRLRVTTTT